jgi:hypothetical protein
VTITRSGPGTSPDQLREGMPVEVTEPGWQRLTKLLAIGALVMFGMRREIYQEISTAHVAGLLMLPLWLPAPKRFWGARVILTVGTVALGLGLWLAWLSSADHSISRGVLIQNMALLSYLLLGLGVFLWARTLMPDWQVGLAYGLGLALAAAPGNAQYAGNPWKYGLGITGAVIVLSLAARTGKRWVEVLASVGLAISFAAVSGRSAFGVLMLTAAIVGLMAVTRRPDGRRRWFPIVAALVVGFLAAYNIGVAALVGGYLGEASQERTIRQIDASGNALVGGRPEMAATVALIESRPWGLGPGVAANLDDILVAKTAMATLNYDPNNGYVERYMLGPRSTLHSVAGDMWIRFGIPGLIFVLTFVVIVVRELAIGIRHRTASALVVYSCLWTLWSVFFEPMSSAIPLLLVAGGLTLQRMPERAEHAVWVPQVRAAHATAGEVSPAP